MKAKKTPKADLQNKKTLFLQIGILVSLAICIGIFSYSQKEKITKLFTEVQVVDEYELPPITPDMMQKPASVAKIIVPAVDVIRIVDNDKRIETTLDIPEYDPNMTIEAPKLGAIEAPVDDDIFIVVEQMPSFNGGDIMAFRKWVISKLIYPRVAAENNVKGKVVVSFVVDKDGSVSGIEILQTPDASLTAEAIRVLQSSPKWTPGKQRNNPVRVKFTLPIDFKLDN